MWRNLLLTYCWWNNRLRCLSISLDSGILNPRHSLLTKRLWLANLNMAPLQRDLGWRFSCFLIGLEGYYHFQCTCSVSRHYLWYRIASLVPLPSHQPLGPSKMDDLSDINFLAMIEGQDYEKSLQKIVSRFHSYQRSHLNTIFYQNKVKLRLNSKFCTQGFTQLHFMPLEVLAIIEGVQKD